MRIAVTLEFEDFATAARFFEKASIDSNAVSVEVKPAAGQDKKTTAAEAVADANARAAEAKAKKAADAKAKAEAEAAAAAADAEDLAGDGEAAKELDYDTDVKPAFQAFLKAKGRDAGLALLAKYEAKSGADLPKARLHEVLADIEAAG